MSPGYGAVNIYAVVNIHTIIILEFRKVMSSFKTYSGQQQHTTKLNLNALRIEDYLFHIAHCAVGPFRVSFVMVPGLSL